VVHVALRLIAKEGRDLEPVARRDDRFFVAAEAGGLQDLLAEARAQAFEDQLAHGVPVGF
jgi:hypothetical protein